MPGGAAVLGQLVKSFAAARLANRIVAVFDNDTAAQVVIETLSHLKLPDNMRVFRLPDLKLAETYPTLGPTGISTMNVNGLACSIELFLGEEVLRGLDGNMVPVQWTGFESKLRRYQGELVNKAEVQERFQRKLACCESSPKHIANFDWSGLHHIIHILRGAFSEAEGEAHLEYECLVAQES